jgi:hypothetical protein
MPRRLVAAALLAVAPLALGAAVAASACASWRWPVRGRVVGAFAHDARTPFRAGPRRGLDLAARPGAPVRAACRGPVLFAGRLPGRGLGVTLACGSLRATLLGLSGLTVRRGRLVPAGAVIGILGPSGRLRLGARRDRERFGYVDPAELLGPDPIRAPPVVPPVGGRPRRLVAPPPGVMASPLPAPAPLRASAPGGPPALAWAGLVLAAAGLPVGALLRRGRRRRRLSARVVARDDAARS